LSGEDLKLIHHQVLQGTYPSMPIMDRRNVITNREKFKNNK